MLTLIAIFTLVIAFLIYKYFSSSRNTLKLPPGPKGWPLVGNLLQLSKHPHESYTKWKNEFGDIIHLKFGTEHVIVVSDARLVKELYNENASTGRSEKLILSLLSRGKNGVLMSVGPTWTEQRRFTLRHLRDFGFGKNYMEGLIMDEVTDFIESLKKDGKNDTPVRMNDIFELAVINALWMIAAGKKFKQDDQDKLELFKDFERNFTKLSPAAILYTISPSLVKLAPGLLGYTKLENLADRVHEMLREVIQEHADTLPEDDSNARDFIDSFLMEINKTEDVKSSFFKEEGLKQLCAGIGDLFFAGSATTSTTLSWSILYLATHPAAQKKLQEGIDEVTGKSRPVALADRSSLPYAEACVSEVLRQSTILVNGVFHTALEDIKFHGFDIPEGSFLMTNQHAIHHDPKTWGDPDNFRPERFLTTDGLAFVKNENLIPFSVGKRSCIGESLARDEIFLFMTNIFQRFNVILDPGRPTPSLEGQPGFLRKPQEFHVILKDRLA